MPKKQDDIIEPIDANFEDVTIAICTDLAPGLKTIKNNDLNCKHMSLTPTPKQEEMFPVERQIEYQEIEMGVLESGIPYLTGRGLSRMVGVDYKSLRDLVSNWSDEKYKPRGKAINRLLVEAGYTEESLFLKAKFNNQVVNAFTEPVCMALLEYYAFLADEKRQKAIETFRILAKLKFREFIYQAVGYTPQQKELESWKHFQDRTDITMDTTPSGYFCIFREIAIMIVPMIRAGIFITDKMIPDISVGQIWSKHWVDAGLGEKYGAREKYPHEYPSYYPQAKSNPQPAWAYPESALGAFRAWLREKYILSKFPAYLLTHVKQNTLKLEVANKALKSFGNPQLNYKPRK